MCLFYGYAVIDLKLSVFTTHQKNNDEGGRKLQEAIDLFMVLTVVKVLQVCIYPQTHQIVYTLNIYNFLHINHASIKGC